MILCCLYAVHMHLIDPKFDAQFVYLRMPQIFRRKKHRTRLRDRSQFRPRIHWVSPFLDTPKCLMISNDTKKQGKCDSESGTGKLSQTDIVLKRGRKVLPGWYTLYTYLASGYT